MQKFIKVVAVSALVITGSTAAHAGGWGKGGNYGSFNHTNRQLLNIAPNIDLGLLNGNSILSGNSTSVLNGIGLNVLGGNKSVVKQNKSMKKVRKSGRR